MATEIIKKSLYNGTVEIDFYPKSHQYKINGKNILSCSGISGVYDKSGPLMRWATNVAKDYLKEKLENNETIQLIDLETAQRQYMQKKDEAADTGKEAHARLENYGKNGELSLPEDPKVANIVNAFLEWKLGHNVEFIHNEIFVYSKEHNYCGTLDVIAKINGKLYLLDFKTSNAIRKMEYGMQTAGYKMAYEEEYGVKLDGIIVLRLSKEEFDKEGNPKPQFEVWEVEDVPGFEKAFLAAKTLKEYGKQYEYKKS